MLRAIIVDDEVNATKALVMILAIFFPNINVVSSFSNSIEALDFIENNTFDLLFLDLDMPHFNGIQVLEKYNIRDFKIFVVSANEILVRQAKFLNADSFINKPVNNEELEECLKENFPKIFK